MLSVLSPAKKLLPIEAPYLGPSSQPLFETKAQELIELMKTYSVQGISQLMHLSMPLATLNHDRYHAFYAQDCPAGANYPAILYFQGDVYQSLDAKSLDEASLEYAQAHLGILSGLYGLLKPLDLIQAYRLEMGTKLVNSQGKNLYNFWQHSLSQEINQQLRHHAHPVLINLASQEYFKAINPKTLDWPILNVAFKERVAGHDKIIGIHAKKARGLMARFIIDQRIDEPAKLKEFNLANYKYCPKSSSTNTLNFVRNAISAKG